MFVQYCILAMGLSGLPCSFMCMKLRSILCLVLAVVVSGCSSGDGEVADDGSSSAGASSTSTSTTLASSSESSSTMLTDEAPANSEAPLDNPDNATPSSETSQVSPSSTQRAARHYCTTVTQSSLAAAGVSGTLDAGQDVSKSHDLNTSNPGGACTWEIAVSDGAGGTSALPLTLVVEEGSDTKEFEQVVADEMGFVDPLTSDGLGIKNAYAEDPDNVSNMIIVVTDSVVFKLSATNSTLVNHDSLVKLASSVAGAL